MRPGKPLIFGELQQKPFIGLPGNPVSTMICGLIFLKPAIETMLGLEHKQETVFASLSKDLHKNDERQDYLRAYYFGTKKGEKIVEPFSLQDSSMMANLAKANCLIVREPFDKKRKKGDPRATYIMITGDKSLSPNNDHEINACTNEDNINGEKIKVVIISKAGSEGIDLKNIQGSGEGGRIIKKDLESIPSEDANIPSQKIDLPKIIAEESYDEIAVSQMRKTISKRLSESKFTSPHFYLTMEINMDNCIEGRKRINETSQVKISFNDIILKACASALRKHPMVNSSLIENKIRKKSHT